MFIPLKHDILWNTGAFVPGMIYLGVGATGLKRA